MYTYRGIPRDDLNFWKRKIVPIGPREKQMFSKKVESC